MAQILDHEKISKVVSAGHDWGSRIAQRLYLFHPNRVVALCLMNVAYAPPGPPLDLDQLQGQLEGMLGYFPYWYWYLFCSEEGPKIMQAHLERAFDICHVDRKGMMDTFCKKDGMKDCLLGDQHLEVREYATPEMKKKFVERFRMDGFEAPVCWYKAVIDNVANEAEQQIPRDRYVLNMPVLFVGGKDDVVCLTNAIYTVQEKGLTPDLTVHELNAGHWLMLSNPKELGEVVIKWLKKIHGRDRDGRL